jgi:geranylgeranyl pyrophosphate synthase
MTHPVIVALQRDPELGSVLEDLVLSPVDEVPEAAKSQLLSALRHTGALESTRDLAIRKAEDACSALGGLPDGRAREALITVARATVHRES